MPTNNSVTFPFKDADGTPRTGATLPINSDGNVTTSDAGLGTDGLTPPNIAGTGVRGWLRGIYEKLSGTLTVTGPLTNTQLRATPIPVSLSEIEIKNDTGSPLPTADEGLGLDGTGAPVISGTGVRGWLRGIYEKLSGTLVVSGPLTEDQLRATAVTVSLAETKINNNSANPVPTADGGLGTDGPTPPSIAGTGARGWLRAIFERLSAVLKVDTVIAVTATNRSGTVTAGGTAQTLMAANANRRGYSIQNLSNADLWINELGTAAAAQPSIKIPAGQLYETPPHQVSVGLVSIFGATTGQAFSAREF